LTLVIYGLGMMWQVRARCVPFSHTVGFWFLKGYKLGLINHVGFCNSTR